MDMTGQYNSNLFMTIAMLDKNRKLWNTKQGNWRTVNKINLDYMWNDKQNVKILHNFSTIKDSIISASKRLQEYYKIKIKINYWDNFFSRKPGSKNGI